MAMVCPRCSGAFENSLQCPQCDVRLLYQPPRWHAGDVLPAQSGKWHQSPSGRITVGLLLAVGLTYGLLQMATSVLGALGLESGGRPLPTNTALGLFFGLQGLALLAGGMLTGACRRQGFTLGACVGIMSGAFFIGAMLCGLLGNVVRPFSAELLSPTALRTTVFYSLPILQAVCGALGGAIGGFIWKPPLNLSLRPGPAARGPSVGNLPARGPAKPLFPWDGPVAVCRVVVGILIAVGGAVSPKAIIDWIVIASDGALQVANAEEYRFLTAEIFAFSILIGGCIAGSTTPNGIKQGLCVGLGAGLFMASFTFRHSGLHVGPVLLSVVSAMLLGSMGGWFGGELLPPIYRQARTSRRSPWWAT